MIIWLQEYTTAYNSLNLQMSITIVTINQKKCNFCYSWIAGPSLSKDTLNCCDPCLNKYSHQDAQVRTVHGQTYKMILIKQSEHYALTGKRIIDNLWQIQNQISQDQIQSLEGVETIIEENGLSNEDNEDGEVIEESIKEDSQYDQIQAKNRLNTEPFREDNDEESSSSMLLNSTRKESGDKWHQSCIFNQTERAKERHLNSNKSLKSLCRLDDYCSNLNKSRLAHRYKYYYDSQSIKSFKDHHPVLRQFGNEIDNLSNNNDPNYTFKGKISRFKMQKSNLFDSKYRFYKLPEQELKSKLQAYIQSRYHTPSLHKPMLSYVKQAYEKTTINNSTIELTSFKIGTMDLHCYLSLFDFDQIRTVKLINVGLTDQQLPILVDFIKGQNVQTLVLTGNRLTENSLQMFMNQSLPSLKQIYLGNNPLNKYRMKENITQLRSKFILYL